MAKPNYEWRQSYSLYARILRLTTDFPEDCRRRMIDNGQDPEGLFDVVRDVVAGMLTNDGLVWC